MRAWVGLTLAILVMVGAPASLPSAASAIGYVGIAPPGTRFGSELSLSALPGNPAPDVVDRSYGNVITPDGSPSTVRATGFVLPTLLSALHLSATGFTVAEVQTPDGRPLLLSNEQATAQAGYADGPPIVSEVDGRAQFLLPSSDGSPGQTVVAPTVQIKLHSGALLVVQAAAPPSPVAVGQRMSVSGAATGALPGETLSYRWNFDDGTGAATPDASHAYQVPGTYEAYLSVTGDQDSIGISAPVPIVVGKAPQGPNRKGGGTNPDAAAPTSGAGTKGSPHKGAHDKNRGTGTGTDPSLADESAVGDPAPHTAPSPKPLTRPAQARKPNRARSSRPKPKPKRSRRTPKRRSHPRSSAPRVKGIALTSAPMPAQAIAHQRRAGPLGVANPARTGHPTPSQLGLGPWLWGLLAVAVLVLAGALTQRRGLSRLRPRA